MPPPPRRGGGFRPKGRIGDAIARAEREQANVKAKEAEAQAQAAAAAAARKRPNVVAASGPQCANKYCTEPKVVDGICRSCGVVADDSNIVAEVQFGETSSGAAMVQGSFVGADQGGARTLGPGMRRAGGSDHRQKSLAEAKSIIQGYASRLRIAAQQVVDVAVRTFTLSSQHGFTQGRPLPMVCAACLYMACRLEKNHVMLLDLADLTQINVFRLGRAFKTLLKKIPVPGVDPLSPEDIIHRLAAKLEFGTDISKVAEDALRLVYSMRRDWIVMGRRPSGICGACLLIAARMNNYRRTMREIVYVVKVTSHTIQERMKEFNETMTSKMTIDDFLSVDLEQSSAMSHDPPSFYRNQESWQQRKEEERRKRKRTHDDAGDADRDQDGQQQRQNPALEREESVSSSLSVPASQQTTTSSSASQQPATPVLNTNTTQLLTPGPDLSAVPSPADAYRRDPDGYLIPPVPPQITSQDPALRGTNTEDFENLVDQFGDAMAKEGSGDKIPETVGQVDTNADADADGKPTARRTKNPLPINEDWENDEQDIEKEISEIMNDPETMQHAKAYGNAEQRARIHAMWALQNEPKKDVSMAVVVEEDEFADDPEVQNAVLTPEEAKLKELLWVNENKDWLRQSQQRMFQRKLDAGKPKRPRKRHKGKGEAQSTPAGTPMEAAQNVMKHHGMSKRINYDAISSLLNSGPGGGSPAAAPSPGGGASSKANSVLGDAFREKEEQQTQDEFSQSEAEEAEEEDETHVDYNEYGDEYDGFDQGEYGDEFEEHDLGGDNDDD